MCEPPGAKRVRREDLQSPASSPRSTPDHRLEELWRSTFDRFAYTTAENDHVTDQHVDAAPSDDEAELRLFAAPADQPANAATVQKIRLSSPGAAAGEPGFLTKKPRAYYFADEPTSAEEAAFQSAAIDGRTVLELSRQPWPGCALPWKVRTITAAGMKREVLVGHPSTLVTLDESARKRTRKGKKARIAIRKKLHVTKEKQSQKARLAQAKEEAEREKRTRRNREKKVKKKAREKAKKAANGSALGGADDNSKDAVMASDSD
ncbi:hypothetical protein ACN47E_003238 [Coniothyrium glycines]